MLCVYQRMKAPSSTQTEVVFPTSASLLSLAMIAVIAVVVAVVVVVAVASTYC